MLGFEAMINCGVVGRAVFWGCCKFGTELMGGG